MSEIFTKRLAGQLLAAQGDQIVGQCPAGRHWVIRTIDVFNGGGGSGLAAVDVGPGKLRIMMSTVANGTVTHLDTRQVVQALESISVYWGGAAGTGMVTITGYDFPVPA